VLLGSKLLRVKHLLYTILSFMLLGATAPGLSYACGSNCGREAEQVATHSSAHGKDVQSSACCEKSIDDPASKEQDCGGSCCNDNCNGNCNGNCGSNCGCPAAHAGAIMMDALVFNFHLPEPHHTGFSYITPFMSNISLDIWLPPNIRA